MKVICIDDAIKDKEGELNFPQPYFGDIDTVIKQFIDDDGEFYMLERFGEHCYSTYHFAPISDIDEMELINERTNQPQKKVELKT